MSVSSTLGSGVDWHEQERRHNRLPHSCRNRGRFCGRERPLGGTHVELVRDRRRVLVEVTPRLRQQAAQLYGTPDEGADELAAYPDEQHEFLIAFLRGSVAYQEERMRRLEAFKARDTAEGRSPSTAEPPRPRHPRSNLT